ncbi:hypothetical protein ALISP_1872 [Alicycliphilus sp. B1]|nr:hypothetical protein ALISP_1872 [Alicycliphilus sp. B1]
MPAQRFEHHGQQPGADAGRDAHLHEAIEPRGAAPDQLDQIVAGRQQLASFLHQRLTGLRQFSLPPAAHDEVCLQARLQLLDVQADGGRREVQRLRGGGEGAQVRDGDQRLQLVEVEVAHQDL